MFEKNSVTTKEQLDELYNSSALTFTRVSEDEESMKQMLNWLKEHSEVSEPLPVHIIKGKVMNENYGLTGNNAYPNDLTLISIKLNDIKDVGSITMARFEVGGRWFDDIVDNNAIIEKHKQPKKQKPKCVLIGQDGNIFNLMGIASRTLKRNGMQEEAKEMCDKITKSGSYDQALAIISDYVEITDQEEVEENEI